MVSVSKYVVRPLTIAAAGMLVSSVSASTASSSSMTLMQEQEIAPLHGPMDTDTHAGWNMDALTGLMEITIMVHGVSVEAAKSIVVDGTATVLRLNGAGLRAIRFLGIDFHVYVGAMYSATPITTYEQALEAEVLHMEFTFLRGVGAGKVAEAWREQTKHSITYHYDGYEEDIEKFIGMFGALKNRGVEMMQIVGDETLIWDQGEFKGKIVGKDFQKAFLSMWFGEQPVSEDLRAGLLSGGLSPAAASQ
uniref:Chalcone isomerase domain-containing protein n=1 Tax=Grammatophora oceanica TaxID=210454 RepID=A0A7S1V1S8_9STRA|mmetsp:Transcript_31409/g.46610  ORF Transcript_31409/g.46610 Transcript_31409/m.46610 type:complete len:249 (+) Transcript_31409:79-825(+)|eukprot:CAMPEP_0194045604 /NCGR_PEP_ID=MMETSP0009_2-20130614/16884_1 /TAXON_ID=210454 /ORGANISM="Grammatophora oceanica, Strain CCMP 410" /LENGTH=248 /DNA_ID=CAMNT_0038690489 /DNA_START=79 /DNA_END=825 /DNA_ORIENTATION=-